ncbi:uncharacterized protein LOC136030076 isoform X2 [Artemia franciscana]|uniref:Uncharacterized protein n=1 Tax=Artemia franciscana TaxID=6661 RepID=A0AA88L2U1_ARTSF|nr:hypothetical protein QYM36_015929 [Artemia franciscana]
MHRIKSYSFIISISVSLFLIDQTVCNGLVPKIMELNKNSMFPNSTNAFEKQQSREARKHYYGATRKDSSVSESGYGGSGGYGGYDCNSALGLFGLLGLLSVLRNILNQLTQATTGRRRRTIEISRLSLLNEMMGGMAEDITDVMSKDLPVIIIPLVAQFAEMSDYDHPSECALRATCLANRHIVGTYGGVGRAVANMVTSTITSQFIGSAEYASKVMKAAKKGRKMEDCLSLYKRCENQLNVDSAKFFELDLDVDDVDDLDV